MKIIDEEYEQFKEWRMSKLTPIDRAFEKIERMMQNPYMRVHDVGFKAIYECLQALREEIQGHE